MKSFKIINIKITIFKISFKIIKFEEFEKINKIFNILNFLIIYIRILSYSIYLIKIKILLLISIF